MWGPGDLGNVGSRRLRKCGVQETSNQTKECVKILELRGAKKRRGTKTERALKGDDMR
jgi:hypothetical protein